MTFITKKQLPKSVTPVVGGGIYGFESAYNSIVPETVNPRIEYDATSPIQALVRIWMHNQLKPLAE